MMAAIFFTVQRYIAVYLKLCVHITIKNQFMKFLECNERKVVEFKKISALGQL
jgi:hypothetical protein